MGCLAWALYKTRHQVRTQTAIPGPSGVPVLGLVLAFTRSLTHRGLANLAQTLNAKTLMAFSLGFSRFIISSEPETAKELLNSSAFVDRSIKESAYELLCHRAMGFAPFGEYWRNLRRISSIHLFSPKRIASFGDFRHGIGLKMVEEIRVLVKIKGEVEEPQSFKPQRFMREDVAILGSDLRLAPFGSGRRVCPGKAMGLATVELWLAQLLQSFQWVPGEAAVDLSERVKLSMEMKKPWVCKAVPRVFPV
ncbi:hypothetical protein SLEP1_g43741 [Rubroshorea leprosula]|uniref:Cytochrome P450 n=1 Tax=Rubroshorea leprosula TaxID=152421 RepID=A0AAV5LEH4_9ROSI|nr:hypothetical protein SLEP1_g43741 [Rubroshorea leprosula]